MTTGISCFIAPTSVEVLVLHKAMPYRPTLKGKCPQKMSADPTHPPKNRKSYNSAHLAKNGCLNLFLGDNAGVAHIPITKVPDVI